MINVAAIEYERHADEHDRASALELQHTDDALRRIQERAASQIYPGFKGKCEDCETPLPKERIKNGRIRCVECQTELEKLEKRGR